MEWTFNGRAVEDCFGKTITIKNEEYKTNFVLRSAVREHAGTYLLTATNINGQDKNGVEVIVLGKPSAPEGPLEVSNVLENSATISWKPPVDNGGMQVWNHSPEIVFPKNQAYCYTLHGSKVQNSSNVQRVLNNERNIE
jgi:hypothetical protein